MNTNTNKRNYKNQIALLNESLNEALETLAVAEAEETAVWGLVSKLIDGERKLTDIEAQAIITELDGNQGDGSCGENLKWAEHKVNDIKEAIAAFENDLKALDVNSRQVTVDDSMTDEEILALVKGGK